eukprot:515228-Prymnesium_polylepis.1
MYDVSQPSAPGYDGRTLYACSAPGYACFSARIPIRRTTPSAAREKVTDAKSTNSSIDVWAEPKRTADCRSRLQKRTSIRPNIDAEHAEKSRISQRTLRSVAASPELQPAMT